MNSITICATRLASPVIDLTIYFHVRRYLKTRTFLGITILSGLISGVVLSFLNLGVVEPYIDKAIVLETQRKISSGENVNLHELVDYRAWQKSGVIAAGAVYGVSLASLFGIAFAYGRNILPTNSNKKKALFLAGVMWVVLYLMVMIKYPANPPAVGDPHTIYYRQSLFVGYLALSGFSALGVAIAWKKLPQIRSKKVVLPSIYALIMIAAYLAFPPNPDKISISVELIQTFRIASALTIGIFWGLLAIIFGSMWDKFKPHEHAEIATI